MIAVPEGMWHRFTLDKDNHIVALRLFVGYPVWTVGKGLWDMHLLQGIWQAAETCRNDPWTGRLATG